MPEQIELFPTIAEGIAGKGFTVILCVCAELLPHVLLAVTETVPLALPIVEVIVSVVLVPDHPPGNVHVYEVAFATAPTEKPCVEL